MSQISNPREFLKFRVIRDDESLTHILQIIKTLEVGESVAADNRKKADDYFQVSKWTQVLDTSCANR